MICKQLIYPERVRLIPKQFSWVDQEVVRSGYVKRVSAEALGLYLVLVTVGDSQGLSYFSDRTLAQYLSCDICKLRTELIRADMIAYKAPLYQVLSLKSSSSSSSRPSPPQQARSAGDLQSVAEVLRSIGSRR